MVDYISNVLRCCRSSKNFLALRTTSLPPYQATCLTPDHTRIASGSMVGYFTILLGCFGSSKDTLVVKNSTPKRLEGSPLRQPPVKTFCGNVQNQLVHGLWHVFPIGAIPLHFYKLHFDAVSSLIRSAHSTTTDSTNGHRALRLPPRHLRTLRIQQVFSPLIWHIRTNRVRPTHQSVMRLEYLISTLRWLRVVFFGHTLAPTIALFVFHFGFTKKVINDSYVPIRSAPTPPSKRSKRGFASGQTLRNRHFISFSIEPT